MLNGIVPRDWSEPELFLTKRIYVVLPNNFLFSFNHFSFFTKLANAVKFFNKRKNNLGTRKLLYFAPLSKCNILYSRNYNFLFLNIQNTATIERSVFIVLELAPLTLRKLKDDNKTREIQKFLFT